ncbi:MAG: hypothetical protein ABIP79_01260 [Chitinophagaceae bacterium]
MKKAIVIFLLLVYGFTSMGATVYVHYCMDEFAGWSLFNGKDEKCGKCGMEEKDKKGCCKEENKQFKLKVDQQKDESAQLVNLGASQELTVPVFEINSYSSIYNSKDFPLSHAPPGIGRNKLHVLHCIFLI